MNTPQPNDRPHPVATTAKVSLPTLGSILGSAGGVTLAAKLGITDPVTVGTLVTIVTAIVTGLCHFIGEKIGVNLS